MKKYILSALIIAGAGFGLLSCNNGDYDADPNADYSNGINPLNPKGGINTNFDWTGSDPMSAEINGNAWKADGAFYLVDMFDTTEAYIVGANFSGDTSGITLRMERNVEPNKLYYVNMGNTKNTASYTNAMSDPNDLYASTLANLGAVKILENDATHIKGLFYFLAKSETGIYLNVQKGYFNIDK
jgi:hypothetical protein